MYIKMEAIPTLYLIISCTLLLCVNGRGNAAPFPKIDAIYQFGDSISDTGNVFFQAGNVGCGMSPYGETFFHHPTGRCSDGLLMVDHIARALRLPLVDPYLARSGNFTHGVNFAVAGATALDISFLAAKKITAVGTTSSLLVQLGWFKSHLYKTCTNPSARRQKLRNALFIVGGIGGDDYNSGGLAGENLQDLRRLVPDVVQAISNVVREVINLGARRIIVPGSFPVGCMPICGAGIRVGDPSYDDLGCLKSWNEFAAFHNSQLQGAIINIQRQNPGVRVVYGDYFSALYSLMRNAPALGFDPNGLYTPCCSNCGSPAGTSCPNPSSRVSWDGLHMTQHAYQYVANQLLKQIRKM
ncbi:acetylajmalan esterase-like [Silene latifolia]|uniref:acetylajmalan esterase-like n=1 Tax=Silene latifolia TaxID=37657 RepID=UPI003D76F0B9